MIDFPFTSWVKRHGGNSQACSGQWSECAVASAALARKPSAVADSVRGDASVCASHLRVASAQRPPAAWIGSESDAR
jgi:hypothetical protein